MVTYLQCIRDLAMGPSEQHHNMSFHVRCIFDLREDLDSLHVLFLTQRGAKDYDGMRKSHAYFGSILKSLEGRENAYKRVGMAEGVDRLRIGNTEMDVRGSIEERYWEAPDLDAERLVLEDFVLLPLGLGEYPKTLVTLIWWTREATRHVLFDVENTTAGTNIIPLLA